MVIKVFLFYQRLFRHIQKVVNGVLPVVEELLRGAAGAVPPVSLALLPYYIWHMLQRIVPVFSFLQVLASILALTLKFIELLDEALFLAENH